MRCPICGDCSVDRILDRADVVVSIAEQEPMSATLVVFACPQDHVFFVRSVDMEKSLDGMARRMNRLVN